MTEETPTSGNSTSNVGGKVFAGILLSGLLLAGVFVADHVNTITHCGPSRQLATAIAIEKAINNFHTEYDKLPAVGDRVTTDSPEGVKLLTVLRGCEAANGSAQNSRNINFLAVKDGKNNRNGLIYKPDGRSVRGCSTLGGIPIPWSSIKRARAAL